MTKVPDEWVGREVRISVLVPGGFDSRTYARLPLAGSWRTGVIEAVNDRGIYGTFKDYSDDPDEEQEQVFYSWGGVISVTLFE